MRLVSAFALLPELLKTSDIVSLHVPLDFDDAQPDR